MEPAREEDCSSAGRLLRDQPKGEDISRNPFRQPDGLKYTWVFSYYHPGPCAVNRHPAAAGDRYFAGRIQIARLPHCNGILLKPPRLRRFILEKSGLTTEEATSMRTAAESSNPVAKRSRPLAVCIGITRRCTGRVGGIGTGMANHREEPDRRRQAAEIPEM